MSPPLPPNEELGLEGEARRVDQLAREVLGDSYLHFRLDRISMEEDVLGESVRVKCAVSRSGSEETIDLEGEGVGLIDAFFDGVVARFADEYPSLKTIKVADFSLGADVDAAQGRKSDAIAKAELTIENSAGARFSFTHAAPSVTRSSVRAALDALTFFINSERAYIQLHVALKDAKERRRNDLVERFRSQMSTLVGATSYSDVIERIRAEAEDAD